MWGAGAYIRHRYCRVDLGKSLGHELGFWGALIPKGPRYLIIIHSPQKQLRQLLSISKAPYDWVLWTVK